MELLFWPGFEPMRYRFMTNHNSATPEDITQIARIRRANHAYEQHYSCIDFSLLATVGPTAC